MKGEKDEQETWKIEWLFKKNKTVDQIRHSGE